MASLENFGDEIMLGSHSQILAVARAVTVRK